jgi:RND family efflux transporter MFP subunit
VAAGCSDPPLAASAADAAVAAPAVAAAPAMPEGLVAVVVPRNTVDVGPRVEGKLREVVVRQGDRVRQGQVLARIDDLALRSKLIAAQEGLRAARSDLRRAKSEYRNAQRRADRRNMLVNEGVIAAEEADDARFAEAKASEARVSASAQIARLEAEVDQLQRDVEAAVLTAPFDGRVARFHADPGAQLFPGKGVVTIISDGIVVKFAAPPERASEIVVGRKVVFRAPGVDVSGTVATVAPELDPAAKMLFATVELSVAPASWPAIHTVGRIAFVDVIATDAGGPCDRRGRAGARRRGAGERRGDARRRRRRDRRRRGRAPLTVCRHESPVGNGARRAPPPSTPRGDAGGGNCAKRHLDPYGIARALEEFAATTPQHPRRTR